MDDKIKSAFDGIHADSSLKDNTKEFLAKKLYEKENRKSKQLRLAPALACAVIMLTAVIGYFSYTTPVMAISLDVNPSIELQVNTFNRIVEVTPYNDDGKNAVLETDVKNMKYQDGINALMDSKIISDCLKNDNLVEITVATDNSGKYEKVKASLAAQDGISANCIYNCENNEDVETAHSLGLSLGKYRAFLELQQVNPDITADDVKGMTMKQIRELINENSGGSADSNSENNQGSGQGNGNGQGSGQGNGNGSGQGNQYGKNK